MIPSRAMAWMTAAALALAADVAPAQAAFKAPDCATLRQWSAGVPVMGRGGGTPEQRQQLETARKEMTSDARTEEVFGRPMSQWHTGDREAARAVTGACVEAMNRGGDTEAARKLAGAGGYLLATVERSASRALTDNRLDSPDCMQVGAWAKDRWTAPDGTSLQVRVERMFADEPTAALFGMKYSSWQRDDMVRARETVGRCLGELFPRDGPVRRDPDMMQGLQAAQSHLANRLRQLGWR